MTNQEIIDIWEFELALANIVLTDWKYKFTKLVLTNKSKAYRNGIVHINTKCPTRHDMLVMLADLHCGFIDHDKFLWQRTAKQLGIIQEITANDYAECTLCNRLTPLTTTKLCLSCKRIKEAVLENPDIARQILKEAQH